MDNTERLDRLEALLVQEKQKLDELKLECQQRRESMKAKLQCIDLYERKIKRQIFIDLDDELEDWDLFDILNGKHDKDMTDEEIGRKDGIASSLDLKFRKHECYNKRQPTQVSRVAVFDNFIESMKVSRDDFGI